MVFGSSDIWNLGNGGVEKRESGAIAGDKYDSSLFARLSIVYRLDLHGRVNSTFQPGYSFEGKERLVFSEEVDILTAGPLCLTL